MYDAPQEFMEIKSVLSKAFAAYGRVLKDVDVTELTEQMAKTPMPSEVIYVASDEGLESLKVREVLESSVYGQMPVQIGYCNGHNQKLNALEYHRNSEINVAVTDLILLLGKQQDIAEDYTYDTDRVEAFMVPAGTAVEIYATTLHYAPCGVNNQGFRCVVVLPRGTNFDLKENQPKDQAVCRGEDRLLAAVNKWLIAHADAKIDKAFVGLKGENICVGKCENP